jgi:regulator of RNase E activity RraA
MSDLDRAQEDELIATMRDHLYVAVVSDVLDSLGANNQAMTADIRPIAPSMRTVGRAHTILTTDVYERPEDPYDLEIDSVDFLQPGDVFIAQTNSVRTCIWGELLSTAAAVRGAAGAIIDGHSRDALKIIEMGFATFCTGFRPVDSSYRSQVVGIKVPIIVGGVQVNPGDIVFADFDGIVVVPKAMLAEVVSRAMDKVQGENHSRTMLLEGHTLRDVYNKFGVL